MTDRRQRNDLRRTPQALGTKHVSTEEVAFARHMSQAIAYGTALLMADPDRRGERTSVVERLRDAYPDVAPEQSSEITARAAARLALEGDRRHRYFGDFASRSSDAMYASEWLAADARQLLRQAARARLDADPAALQELLKLAASAKPKDADFGVPRTFVEGGLFTGDVQTTWQSVTIYQPCTLYFRWHTSERAAEQGAWVLTHVGPGGSESLIADGFAGEAPGVKTFAIDLKKYLPPLPPASPATYHVSVSPRTKPKSSDGVVPGSKGPKIPGGPVGATSAPVTITYSPFAPPAPDLTVVDVYRTLSFYLDKIHMIDDQEGPGAEEFHVRGFVQEILPGSADHHGEQSRFGPFFAKLDPDGPRWAHLGHRATFHLPDPPPDGGDWPRCYLVVVSVMEEDDGGSLDTWASGMAFVAEDALRGAIYDEVSHYLEEYIQEYLEKNLADVIVAASDVARLLGEIAASTASAIIGLVVAVAIFVIVGIVSGMADDFYGTAVAALVLPTNVVQLLSEAWVDMGPEGNVIETDPLMFHGHSSYPSAAPSDGIVEVLYSWTLSSVEPF